MAPKKGAPAAAKHKAEKPASPKAKAAAKASPAKGAAPVAKAVIAKRPRGKPRNALLARGIERYSRSAMYKRRGIWAIKAKHNGKLPVHEKKPKVEAPAGRGPKFYPADDVKKPKNRKLIKRPTKLRASITPGTVLILLAGQFKGKRVVFLKQLQSGLLLVTGPKKVNHVPLRRVNQVYVIGTSTKVDISSVNVTKFNDDYFKKEESKQKKGEGQFFESESAEKKAPSPERLEDQKAVDAQLLPLIEAVPNLKAYLGSRFSLTRGMKPHELVF